jgi:DNA-binding response OmpR family regulator
MNRKKILVVDDDAVILTRLAVKLKGSGYDVFTAIDGSQAVSTARKEKPDLILLDITFPPDVAHGGGVAWDGFVIIQWLRRLDEMKNIPIMVITGGDTEKYKDRAMAAGAQAFFHKPVDNDELLTAIHKILGEVSPGTSAPAS